ncbi:MAG: thiol-disulfide oxidoreductase DCC family protein [Chitinophagaceae bacterium]|nr:MAG: thiol-disulfide oxidoreductase DCC family protein [Chitinophagaceae bacterium]
MKETPVILFDGVCNLCNGAVNFIIRRDVHKIFRFAPLQSDAGTKLREQYAIQGELESILLITGGRMYKMSDAALKIAAKLSLPYSLLYGFIIVPPFIRNAVYKLIARNRYKWFGRQESCMMPTPDVNERFLN